LKEIVFYEMMPYNPYRVMIAGARMINIIRILTLIGLSFLVSTSAMAQTVDDGLFNRDRNVSVKDRKHPGYETDGIQSGALIFKPQLDLIAEFDDNIFATDVNEVSDVVAVIAPSVTVETTFSRHSLGAYANLQSRQYIDIGDESHTNFEVGVDGTLDVQRGMYIKAGGAYRQAHEERGAAGFASGSLEPIEFNTTDWFLNGVREKGRTKVQAEVSFGMRDYEDGLLAGGAVADQDYRDRDELGLSIRGDYAVSPDTSIFARMRYTDQEYDIIPFNAVTRDQNGYIIDVGADFDLTNSVRGEIGVGYLNQSFSAPLQDDFSGFSYTGQLEWFATPLITVTANGSRTVEASSLQSSPASVDTRLGLAADYEYRRNIIVSTAFEHRSENYEGIDRNDDRNYYSFGATYLMNRNVGFSANIVHSPLNSDGVNSQTDYGSTKILFGITLKR
jgi:hypothetical protein